MGIERVLQLAAGVLLMAALGWVYLYPNLSPSLSAARSPSPSASNGPAGRSTLAEDMKRETARRRGHHVALEYKRILSLLDAARARGHQVTALEARLEKAARLTKEERFDQALMYLNIIEVSLPRARESVRPAAQEDTPELFPDLERERRKRRAETRR